jgi:hypothetical protein
MSARADIAALVRACPVDWLDAKYGAETEPGDIADQLYAAVRAEALVEGAVVLERIAAETEARVAEHFGAASGIGPGSAEMVTASADTLRDLAGEKSSREAIATPQVDAPLAVRWDRTVIHPEADPADDTIVCCLDAKGRPVALFLDDEHREALGLLLVDPTGEGEPQLTGRRAQLLDAIRTWPGQWTTTRVMAVYRAQGLQDPPRSTARGDLQALTESGDLVVCGPENARYYLLARKDGA